MYKKIFKRVIDVIISGLVLIIFSPVFIVVAIVLFIQNDGKPFFTQNRVGKDERIFKLMKFKSMNDKKGDDGLLLRDVDRITPFGNFIRKTSFDELPQIFNILSGDMSIVGPRPLLTEYLPYYSEYHKRRHEVKPGITGLAQVNGRNFLKFSQRFNFDVEYVDHLSFSLDAVILFKTFFKFFKSSDISMGRKMSEIDDIGITKGLSKHYFNRDENDN